MPFTATAIIGGVQAGVGAVQAIAGQARLKRLMQKRTAYVTPDEIGDMNNMAMNAAQSGFGADTLKYLTSQTDRALTSSLGAAERLGADPNDIANIFDRNVQAIMKTSADNEMLQMQKFNKLYETMTNVAKGKEAEWQSKEMILKDQMAAAAQQVQAGTQNIQSGLNAGLQGLTNAGEADLFKQAKGLGKYAPTGTSVTAGIGLSDVQKQAVDYYNILKRNGALSYSDNLAVPTLLN